MKIITKGVTADGVAIQIEDWSEDYPSVHEYGDQLAAYPVSKHSVPHFYGQIGAFLRDYPKSGERFRLGMHFGSFCEAKQAYEDLTSGKTQLSDYVSRYDTTPTTSAADFLHCLEA